MYTLKITKNDWVFLERERRRGRDRDEERQRGRKRERQIDRQTDRQTDRQSMCLCLYVERMPGQKNGETME